MPLSGWPLHRASRRARCRPPVSWAAISAALVWLSWKSLGFDFPQDFVWQPWLPSPAFSLAANSSLGAIHSALLFLRMPKPWLCKMMSKLDPKASTWAQGHRTVTDSEVMTLKLVKSAITCSSALRYFESSARTSRLCNPGALGQLPGSCLSVRTVTQLDFGGRCAPRCLWVLSPCAPGHWLDTDVRTWACKVRHVQPPIAGPR